MNERSPRHPLSRRSVLLAGGTGVAAAVASRRAIAQAQPQPSPNAQLGTPASTTTSPPRDWTPGRPSIYPGPDVIVIDPHSTASDWATPRSVGCGPVPIGPRAQPGRARGSTLSSATSAATRNTATSGRTVG